MKISYQWLNELIDLNGVSPEKVAEILTARGLEVEETHRMDQGLDKVVTAHIIEKGKHPNSDKLSLCRVDAGTGAELQIVCGAQNHKTGDKVVLAQIGADLPNGLKIGKGVIRGVESQGMLCSESELGLAKESEGILILPQDTPIGMPIAKFLGREDVVFVLKLYANQGHFLSHYGVARDLAAALGRELRDPVDGKGSPHTRTAAPKLDYKNSSIAIDLQAGEKAPQFYGCSIEGVKIGPSPKWLASRLEVLGSRSINNVVDATNLVMLELGHPVHAYDATRISGGKIGVRMSREGEVLPLLDGSEVKLNGTELVIKDGSDKAIGLAGVMGGGNSEVSDTTTKLFLECAEFDPVLVRRAKTRHAKMTDAAARFEKGIDPQGLDRVMRRLTALVLELAGGKVVGSTRAEAGSEHPITAPKPRASVEMPKTFIADFIGVNTPANEIEKILTAQGCRLESGANSWKVTPPSWRLDLQIREDLAEEIARSVGYDQIPSEIPPLSSAPMSQVWSKVGGEAELLDRAKTAFVQLGLCETLNYGFSSAKWLESLGFPAKLKVLNPLSEEHEVMVPSLIPGLLQNALHTTRHHFGSESPVVRLFEIRPTYRLTQGYAAAEARDEMTTGTEEPMKIAFALSGPRAQSGMKADTVDCDFSDLKNIVDGFLDQMGAKGIRVIPLHQSRKFSQAQVHSNLTAEDPSLALISLLHSGKAAEILLGNQSLGFFGVLHPKWAREWKLKSELMIGEFDWNTLKSMCRAPSEARAFKKWSEFPPMERDFAILVDAETTAEKITGVVLKAGKPLAKSAKVFDVYKGAQVPEGKISVATRVVLGDDTRSLTEAEAEGTSQAIIAALKKELGAELR